MNFDKYKDLGGKLSEIEFDQLYSLTDILLKHYCEFFISRFKHKDDFTEYGIDLDRAIVIQMDFISKNGGINVFDGCSDLDVSSVTTSGYTYSIAQELEKIDGIPLSPMVKILLKDQLRNLGYLNRCIS